jgi:hypothetical protein
VRGGMLRDVLCSFALRMPAVRFRWQLKVFTAADSGGAKLIQLFVIRTQ